MAEAFGIAGSAIGVISLGIQVCQGLIQYYGSWKDSNADVAKMLAGLQSLTSTLVFLKNVKVTGTFDEKQAENVRAIIIDLEIGIAELDQELKEVSPIQVKVGDEITFREKMKEHARRLLYPFRESTLKKLQQTIQYIRDNLSLAIRLRDG